MPELPEVETIVREIRPRLVGRTLRSPRLYHRDVLRGVTAPRLLRALQNAEVVGLRRRAKHVVVELESGMRMVIQPRMTGSLLVYDREAAILRAEGEKRLQAIAQAARQRFRPVLLTSLTTILAMMPLALEIGAGAESWSGMARAVIGGLTVATALTLLVVPVMYSAFAKKDAPEEVTS